MDPLKIFGEPHLSTERYICLQWNPVNTVTNGAKKFGRINKGFIQENVWSFPRQPN